MRLLKSVFWAQIANSIVAYLTVQSSGIGTIRIMKARRRQDACPAWLERTWILGEILASTPGEPELVESPKATIRDGSAIRFAA